MKKKQSNLFFIVMIGSFCFGFNSLLERNIASANIPQNSKSCCKTNRDTAKSLNKVLKEETDYRKTIKIVVTNKQKNNNLIEEIVINNEPFALIDSDLEVKIKDSKEFNDESKILKDFFVEYCQKLKCINNIINTQEGKIKLIISNLKDQIIKGERYWEKVTIILIYKKLENNIKIDLIVEGKYSSGFSPPNDDGYYTMEPKYTKALDEYTGTILTKLKEYYEGVFTKDEVYYKPKKSSKT